ncbi:hypothetical protein ACIBQ2_15035 [Micromonospora sediminimaris]|uniref:hypothetical protein n=1 Tax=Micromonospora sediminimaris TaxID=547162 RepID=UPI00379D8366
MTATDGFIGRRQRELFRVDDELAFLPAGTGRGGRHAQAPKSAPSNRATMAWLPLWMALLWLLGTFGAFWLTGLARYVKNPDQLCLFVVGATALFAAGYAVQISRRPPSRTVASTDASKRLRLVRHLVLIAAIYYAVRSLARLWEFGATGPQSVWASLQNPATGYANKLDLLAKDVGEVSPLMWTLAVLGVLGTALVPLLALYWRSLSFGVRLAGLAGIALHVAFFLFIGTMKGLGDLVLMMLGGLLIARATMRRRRRARSKRRSAVILMSGAFALFLLYMTYIHAARSAEFGVGEYIRPSPAVSQLVGERAAEGIASTLFYPTHGYLGLSHNLQTPFQWSYGLGSSHSASMFGEQALGVDPMDHPAYPYRTEAQSGWPALMYWATIYPWLASDLTFPGAALFMGFVGWLFARAWSDAISTRRVLPTLVFTQLCLLVAYVPANNQLGLSPDATAGTATLLALYAAASLFRRHRPDGQSQTMIHAPSRR